MGDGRWGIFFINSTYHSFVIANMSILIYIIVSFLILVTT